MQNLIIEFHQDIVQAIKIMYEVNELGVELE